MRDHLVGERVVIDAAERLEAALGIHAIRDQSLETRLRWSVLVSGSASVP